MNQQRLLIMPLLALLLGLTGCVRSSNLSGHVDAADTKPLVGAVVKAVSESDQ